MGMLMIVVITNHHVSGTRLSTLSEEGERMLRSCGDCRGYDPPKKPCCPPHPHALNTVSAPAMNTSFKQVSPVKYVEVTSEGRVLRSCGDCRGYDPPKEPCCPPHPHALNTVSAPAMNTSFKQVSPVKYVEVTSEGRVLRSCGDCRGYDPPKEPCCPPH